jgi:nucleoprotein TPR
VAHAESVKVMDQLRQQLSAAQATARDNSAAAETAQAKLSTSEASWKQQKETLEKEVVDLKARYDLDLRFSAHIDTWLSRCKDLAAQNNLLHQHLESVSSQASRIRQAAADSSSSEPGEPDAGGDLDIKLSELRSVVAYLRKEKEIVDLQLELSKQETVRLKAQIDHLSRNLEETRATLSEVRTAFCPSLALLKPYSGARESCRMRNI